MRRLAQFVRLRLRLLASRVSRLSVCVCVRLHLSASVVLSRVSRLSASVHVKGSECVRLRLVRLASVSRLRLASVRLHLSRVCLASVSRLSVSHLSASASVSRQGFRMLASVCVCLSL